MFASVRRKYAVMKSTNRRAFLATAAVAPLVACAPTSVLPVVASSSPKVTVRGAPIHCEIRGTGRSLVILHGFDVDHRMMLDAVEPVLASRPGWQRIYFDLPGMGKTPAIDSVTSTDDMLDVVLATVDALIPNQRFALVGQSYGGYLARGVLARRADRLDGMALICPAIIADRKSRDLPPKVVLTRDPALLASLPPADAKDFEGVFVIQTEATWRAFRDSILPAIRAANDPFLERIQKQYSFTFPVDALPRPFERPVLLLAGRQDAIVGYRDAERILENYPRGSFVVLDRAGHSLHIEQPHLFAAHLLDWLGRVEAA